MPAPWSVTVFGPAYIDRVLRVTEPIALEGHRPIDISIQAISLTTAPGNGLGINAPHGNSLKIVVPEGWPGPWGTIQLQEDPWPTCQHNALRKVVNALAWNEDLGGMGAGYARALGGRLIFAIGQPDDPISDQILKKLTKNEIRCTPVRISAKSADWTLLVTSGAYGDKLAIGFRGCNAALQAKDLPTWDAGQQQDALVVAGLANSLAKKILGITGQSQWDPSQEPDHRGTLRIFAPAMRNTSDRANPVAFLARDIDIFSCNLGEWASMTDTDREAVEAEVKLLMVTDAELGATFRVRNGSTLDAPIRIPAFPRMKPPRDTNRAGETFTSTVVQEILNETMNPLLAGPDWWHRVGRRASAAAALVLDLEHFQFPSGSDVDGALHRGVV